MPDVTARDTLLNRLLRIPTRVMAGVILALLVLGLLVGHVQLEHRGPTVGGGDRHDQGAPPVRRRTVGKLDGDMIIVGFAAETGDASATPLEHATAKLARKGCDLLMCNDVSGGATFGAEYNVGWILDADGSVDEVPHGSKHAVAARILDAVARKAVEAFAEATAGERRNVRADLLARAQE